MIVLFVIVLIPDCWSTLQPVKLTDWNKWLERNRGMEDSSKEASTEEIFIFTVFMRSFEHCDFNVLPEDSSELFTMSENRSERVPVRWLPLQAYPVKYFLVPSISSTDGFEGSLLERIKEMSPLALQPCVWHLECCTSTGWSLSISRCKEPRRFSVKLTKSEIKNC